MQEDRFLAPGTRVRLGSESDDPENFVELVTDEQNCLALRLQTFNKFVKLPDFLLAERIPGWRSTESETLFARC